jgi:hypothetical protein
MTNHQRRTFIRFRRGAFDLGLGLIVLLIVGVLYLVGSAMHG